MPLLLVLAILAVCYPFPWRPVLPLGPWGQTAAMLGLVLANISLAAFLSWRVIQQIRYPQLEDRYLAVRRFHVARRFLSYWNLLSTGAIIILGWGWTVWQHLQINGPSGLILFPGAELLIPAPFFLTVFINWAIYWYAETTIEATRNQLPRWPLASYWLFQFRKFLIIGMLPALLMTGFQAVSRVLPSVVTAPGFQLLGVLGMVGIMLILPRLIKVALGWQTMPPGPHRDHLEATAKRLGLRYTDLLLWPTAGSMVNAMVSGLVSWARYVVFTDRILEQLEPEELDAIVGHELGHVHYYHIPYYTLFFIMSAMASATLMAALPANLGLPATLLPAELVPWLALPAFALMGLYYFIFFGLLSRRCERQADIFGCRAGSCLQPDCPGHDASTVLAPAGTGLCRTGVMAMISALDKVGVLNGITQEAHTPWQRLVQWFQAWQHGPIHSRIRFLEQLAEQPELADEHDQQVRRLRLGLMALLIGLIILGGNLIGWAEFWAML